MRRHIIFLGFCLACAVSSAMVFAQALPNVQEHTARLCDHGGYDLWSELRMLPVRFTKFDDNNTAAWKYQDDRMVKVGAFVLNERAHYVSREGKKVGVPYLIDHKDAEWLCYYCAQCNTLLTAYELKKHLPERD